MRKVARGATKLSAFVLSAAGLLSVHACGDGSDIVIGRESRLAVDAGAPRPDDAQPSQPDDAGGVSVEPTTCEEAKTSKSNVGCDFWPTIVPSTVGFLNTTGCGKFQTSIVVSNPGDVPAKVTVTGPNGFSLDRTVAASGAELVDLPNVSELENIAAAETRVLPSGAFHVTSSVPVTIHQFDPYVPSTTSCIGPGFNFFPSNDAMTILPASALTAAYRVMTGMAIPNPNGKPGITVTATAAGTDVVVNLSKTSVMEGSKSGTTIPAGKAGDTIRVTLANPGDVLQLMGSKGSDFSGTLVTSSRAVQIAVVSVGFQAGTNTFVGAFAEEAMPPVEALGKHYYIPTYPPSHEGGDGQILRFYGNVDGTTLVYTPAAPADCPTKLDAGQVVNCIPTDGFEVRGSAAFGLMSQIYGGGNAPSTGTFTRSGALTNLPPVEQFRKTYAFVGYQPVTDTAANHTSWIVVAGPPNAGVKLDGTNVVPSSWAATKGTSFGTYTLPLPDATTIPRHVVTSEQPVAVIVLARDYPATIAYPAGTNVLPIAPVPTK